VTIFVFIAATALAQQPIHQSKLFALYSDRVVEGSYEARAISTTELSSTYNGSAATPLTWKLSSDLHAYPALHSSLPILDGVYNLSLDELTKNIRPDQTLMAGAEWNGVWTRDVSYSAFLSLAIVVPNLAKNSLIAKVSHGEIVQDTGTGGSWPVSSDRMVWALAAWEIYQVTGDRDWLRQSYQIIRNSASHDEHSVLASKNGLAYGESSFMDWREQTYPRWMNAADIYSSQSLSNNAVHYQTYRILAKMARALGKDGSAYDSRAQRIESSMNQLLWMPGKGYYGEYLYGRAHPVLSGRSDSLGESLAMLFGIATPAQQKEMLKKVPLLDYGIPTVYPQTPGIPPYHNESVWPFVQAFWNLAAAKNHADATVADGLGVLLRHTSFFLTSKENLVASTGSPKGTVINSDRQLWSIAGNLSMVYRILFGMSFEADGIHLAPFIPTDFAGSYQLDDFRYRQAALSFRVSGSGGKVRSQTLDGAPFNGVIPASLRGSHHIEIELGQEASEAIASHRNEDRTAPDTPEPRMNGARLSWPLVSGASSYQVFRDGQPLQLVMEPSLLLREDSSKSPREYQVEAIDSNGIASFLSAPVVVELSGSVLSAAFDPSLHPFDLPRDSTASAQATLSIPGAGKYAVRIHYANGAGPINTGNQCGVRSLYIDNQFSGVVVMPQRGEGAWDNWGWSNRILHRFTPGKHTMELRMDGIDNNMNFTQNRVLVDRIEASIVALADPPQPSGQVHSTR
jgi:hypothetical protein